MASRRTLVLAAVLAVLGLVALSMSRATSVAGDTPSYRLVYLSVSGQGPQAKCWYDGGPPQGTLVQAALDHFTMDGYRYAGIFSSGWGGQTTLLTSSSTPPASDPARDPYFVILLERR